MMKTCSVEGCTKPTDRKGFCCAHYMRNHRYGSPTFIKKREMKPEKLCALEGCGEKHLALGFCGRHSRSFRRHSDPLAAGPVKGFAIDFFNEAKLIQTDDCIFWPYAKNTFGYAVMSKRHGTRSVHRIMCIEVHGACPSKKHEVAHECGNGHLGCITPRHLSWKTRSENQMDRVQHGTSNRGERQWNAKLTDARVIDICERLRMGERQVEIARDEDVGFKTISDINTGKTWRWLTGMGDPSPQVQPANRIRGIRR